MEIELTTIALKLHNYIVLSNKYIPYVEYKQINYLMLISSIRVKTSNFNNQSGVPSDSRGSLRLRMYNILLLITYLLGKILLRNWVGNIFI